jgi:hypothetical protein
MLKEPPQPASLLRLSLVLHAENSARE